MTTTQLEALDPTERAWASAAISNLIHNDPSTRRLLQSKNVVGILISRLADSVDEVVVEASGALRWVILCNSYVRMLGGSVAKSFACPLTLPTE